MPSIPTTSPDVEAWLIATFGPTLDGAPVRNQKPKATGAHSVVLIRADLQNKVTPISRYCRVGVQGWKVRADGTADLKGAFDLAASFGAAVESADRTGILLDAEVETGPYRISDSVTGVEYAYLTLLLEVSAT